MPENIYNPNMSFVAEDGLYMSLHINHPDYDPNHLAFEKLDLVNAGNEN